MRILFVFASMLLGLAMHAQQLTNLPTIYINTENNRPVNSKDTYVPGTVTIDTDNPDHAITDKAMGIRGRGNSTWGMAKKPYRIKFDKKIKLFDRPAKAKSWVLLANYADKTLMRNAVAFELSRFVGFDFSPTAVFADVVLNGQYLGNYLVSDQMEVNSGRVDIDEMDATCIEGESLTGGYFLEIDGFGGSEPVHFNTSRGLIITVKSPDDDVIQQVQLNYIKNYIQKFENKLFASDFADSEKGFRQLVDEKSLVDWYICCELTGNSDSFWSTYIYKKRSDDHLYFGPLWDFDIAFNNDNRLGNAVNKLMRENAHEPRTWITRMWQAQWFREAVYARWCELVSDGVEDYLIDYIDQTAQYIDASQARNFNKWRILNSRVYLEQFLFPTYQGGVDYLKRYIHERVAFLTASFTLSCAPTVIDDIVDGDEYYIVHYVGLLATPDTDNFYIRNADFDNQKLTFVSTGESGVWNIRMPDGRFLASRNGDKYCTYTTNGSDVRARFAVEASPHAGYARIKSIATGLYLGVEHIAHNSRISTNKSGTETNHAWKVLPVSASGVSSVTVDMPAVYYDAIRHAIVSDRPTSIDVYVPSGAKILSGCNTLSLSTATLHPGIYIIHAPHTTLKIAIR